MFLCPTLEIDTKGGKINVSTQSFWGRYYQRLVQILVSVYIFAIFNEDHCYLCLEIKN